jgi:glucoamylase
VFLNISPPGATLGSVSASPSRQDPDYYFHWVRDSAIVMGEVVSLYAHASDPRERDLLFKNLDDYVNFSHANQQTVNLSGGVGEPKFNVDGSAFTGEWGRPQNDGPALRAMTLTRFAKLLLSAGGHEAYVRSKLYSVEFPGQSLIKKDLEFVSNHWRDDCFDPWEEVKGLHFYVEMVQRRSLLDGAELADLLGDSSAAAWYRTQAQALEAAILKHWDPERGYFLETVAWSGGSASKVSGLDVAVILGVLHGSTVDAFLSPGNDQVIATAEKLREVFQELYSVNRTPGLGTAIGRYPEDVYDGLTVGDHPGNPWVLATLAYAEFNYRVAQEWSARGRVEFTELNLPYLRNVLGDSLSTKGPLRAGMHLERGQAEFDLLLERIREKGDSFLDRMKYHTPESGSLSEQFSQVSGFMQGARDLGWSYVSFLTAVTERTHLLGH